MIASATYGGYYDCEDTCLLATGESALFIDRASQQCEESCLYQNETTIGGVAYRVCEAANTTTCPYLKRSGVVYLCMAACDTTNKYNLSGLCVTTCLNETRKFLGSDGVNCVPSCSFGYAVSGSEAQCVSTCSWPNAFYVDQTYHLSEKRCSGSCPANTFLSRSTQDCLSACGYRNSTLTGGNTVCETPGNATNCPFLFHARASDAFLTCVSECQESELLFTNGSFVQCVASCPAQAQYI